MRLRNISRLNFFSRILKAMDLNLFECYVFFDLLTINHYVLSLLLLGSIHKLTRILVLPLKWHNKYWACDFFLNQWEWNFLYFGRNIFTITLDSIVFTRQIDTCLWLQRIAFYLFGGLNVLSTLVNMLIYTHTHILNNMKLLSHTLYYIFPKLYHHYQPLGKVKNSVHP